MSVSGQSLSRVEIGRKRRQRDRAILRGIVATAAVRLVSAAASLITLGIAARSLSKDEFGFVAAIVALWMILTMLDLGLGGTLSTRVAKAHAQDDLADMARHVRDGLYALGATGLALGVLGGASAFVLPWGRWLDGAQSSHNVVPSVVLMFVTAGAAMPAAVGTAVLTGRQRMATAQVMNGLGSVGTLVTAAAAGAMHLSSWAFVLAIVGVPTVIGIAVTVRVVSTLPGSADPGGFTARQFVDTLRASGYFAILMVSNSVALGTGTVIVAVVDGAGQAATFSVASRMYAMLYAVVTQSGAQLWPALTEALARRDFSWARRRFVHSVVVASAVAALATLAVVLLGRAVARIWVGPDLVPPLALFVALGGLTIAACATGQAGTLLLATERVRPLSVISVANAVLGTAAAVVLARALGPYGAAIGGLAATVVVLTPGIARLIRVEMRSWPLGGTEASV